MEYMSLMEQPSETTVDQARLLLYYRSFDGGSAQFVCFPHGGISAFEPLPPRSQVLPARECGTVGHNQSSVPGPLVDAAQRYFELPEGGLEADADFRACLRVNERLIDVYLAHFTTSKPPFEAVERKRARLLDLCETQDLCAAERDLLRHASRAIMN